jgi:regulator of sigma E protease
MCLVASLDPALLGHWVLVILQVSLGLGAVIFVHELGHFAVAKMCGVKCDKFFIGFDVGGYKISRKWGETEYGIGILPLGGYVKMLGQDDNPANIAEQVRESEVSDSQKAAKEITGPDGETYQVDPRSYLAKSVPQRMAIISAGVIMNVIFAFIFAVVAFGVGVPYIPCIVSQTSVGSPAWVAGISTGDEVVRVGDIENPSFTDLMQGVSLGDLDNGVSFSIRRAGTDEVENLVIMPERGPGLAKVGISSPSSLRLRGTPVGEDSPAASASEEFKSGDEIIAIDGEAVNDYREYVAHLTAKSDKPLQVTVRRGGIVSKVRPDAPSVGGEEVTISVQPRPRRGLGLMMEKGQIVAVQKGTQAAKKGIQAGDFIDEVSQADDSTAAQAAETEGVFDDPMAWPEQLRRLSEQNRAIRLKVRRSSGSDGRQTPDQTIDLPLRQVTWIEPSWNANAPLSIPSLGIAYRVLNRIDEVEPDSPAGKAGLQSSDVITKAEFVLPESSAYSELDPVEFGEEEQHNWPAFMEQVQFLPSGTKIKLTFNRGDQSQEATLVAEPVAGEYVPQRGFHFLPVQRIRTANSLGEQISLGYDETIQSLTLVFRFLNKLITGQVPATSLGGPVTIAKAAGYSAFEGIGKLLVFLTILSANLAVINFMPIPLLDGGHIVFLVYEGIRGRPASEKFVVAMHTIGFIFIISLMLFVLSLDLEFIDRKL